jgi:aminomethyltransferase
MAKTALFNDHNKLKAKIVPFAGYDMPLFYDKGMVNEHLWVRESCGIFDVSHMGQVIISGEKSAEMLSVLTPTDFISAKSGQAKYSVLLNEDCGVIDDIIATRLSEDKFFVVINAGRKDVDITWFRKHLGDFNCELEVLDRSLIAVQGNCAEDILEDIIGGVREINYMNLKESSWNGNDIFVSRTGYTGEDGFEISVANSDASLFWNKLLENDKVSPIGLGARDSLRLEMGYPLYGHDLREDVNLGSATMKWIINSPQEFIGKDALNLESRDKRVGVKLIDKGIARENMELFNEGLEKI